MAEAETQKPQQRGVWVEKSNTVSVTYGQKRYLIHLNRFTVEGQTWENVKDDPAKAREFREKVIGKFSADGKLLQEGIFQRAMNAITNTNNAINAISNESNPTYKILTGQKKALEDYLFKNGKAEEAGAPEPVPAQAPIRTVRERTVFAPIAPPAPQAPLEPQQKKEEPTPVERAPAQLVAPGNIHVSRTGKGHDLDALRQEGFRFPNLAGLPKMLVEKFSGPLGENEWTAYSNVYGSIGGDGRTVVATHTTVETRERVPPFKQLEEPLNQYTAAIALACQKGVLKTAGKNDLPVGDELAAGRELVITGVVVEREKDGKKLTEELGILHQDARNALEHATETGQATLTGYVIAAGAGKQGARREVSIIVTDKEALQLLSQTTASFDSLAANFSAMDRFDAYAGTFLYLSHNKVATGAILNQNGQPTGMTTYHSESQFAGLNPKQAGGELFEQNYIKGELHIRGREGAILPDRMLATYRELLQKTTTRDNLPADFRTPVLQVAYFATMPISTPTPINIPPTYPGGMEVIPTYQNNAQKIMDAKRAIAAAILQQAATQHPDQAILVNNALALPSTINTLALRLDEFILNKDGTAKSIAQLLTAANFKLTGESRAKLRDLSSGELATPDVIRKALGISKKEWESHGLPIDGTVKPIDQIMLLSCFKYNDEITQQQMQGIILGYAGSVSLIQTTYAQPQTGIQQPLPQTAPIAQPAEKQPVTRQAAAQLAALEKKPVATTSTTTAVSGSIVDTYQQIAMTEVANYNVLINPTTVVVFDGLDTAVSKLRLTGDYAASLEYNELTKGTRATAYIDTQSETTDLAAWKSVTDRFGGFGMYRDDSAMRVLAVAAYNRKFYQKLAANEASGLVPYGAGVLTIGRNAGTGTETPGELNQATMGFVRSFARAGEFKGHPVVEGDLDVAAGTGKFAQYNATRSDAFVQMAGRGEVLDRSFANAVAGTPISDRLMARGYHYGIGNSRTGEESARTGASLDGVTGRDTHVSAFAEKNKYRTIDGGRITTNAIGAEVADATATVRGLPTTYDARVSLNKTREPGRSSNYLAVSGSMERRDKDPRVPIFVDRASIGINTSKVTDRPDTRDSVFSLERRLWISGGLDEHGKRMTPGDSWAQQKYEYAVAGVVKSGTFTGGTFTLGQQSGPRQGGSISLGYGNGDFAQGTLFYGTDNHSGNLTLGTSKPSGGMRIFTFNFEGYGR